MKGVSTRLSRWLAAGALAVATTGRVDASIALSPAGPVTAFQGSATLFTATSPSCNSGFALWTWSVSGGGTITPENSPYPGIANATFRAGNAAGTFTVSVRCSSGDVASATIVIPEVAVSIDPIPAFRQGESRVLVGHVTADDGRLVWSISPQTGAFQSFSAGSTLFISGHDAGEFQVTATSVFDPTRAAVAALTVLGPVQVTLAPSSVTLPGNAAGAYTFSELVSNAMDQRAGWAIDGGGTLVVNSAQNQATFTAANTTGVFHVTAASLWDSAASATSTIRLARISIDPPAAGMMPGTQRQFSARLEGATLPISWSTTIPGASTSGGLLSVPAGTPVGNYALIATAYGTLPIATTSQIAVVATLPPASVAVSPPAATADPGATLQFSARVDDANGDPVSGQGVSWSATAPATITSAGLFTAPAAPGTYTVIAASSADPTKSAQATVRVSSSVEVSPSWITVSPGGGADFQATARGTTGAIQWSVSEGFAGGTISSIGHYQAPGSPGTYHVVAQPSGSSLKGIATIRVTDSPDLFVDVAPDAVEMVRGATRQFSATVLGSTNPLVEWTATAGTIDANGLFVAPSQYGTVTIVATSLDDHRSRGTATVVISDGGAGQALEYDANGNLVSDGSRSFEWDGEDRLVAIVTNGGQHRSEFAYDAYGRRVLQTEKEGGAIVLRRRFLWLGGAIVQELDSPPGSGFVTAASGESGGASTVSAATAEVVGATREASFESADPTRDGAVSEPPSAVLAAAAVYEGFLDIADCSTISGWAWDTGQPNTPISVDILDGSSVIATISAAGFRQDLLNAGKGNGYHAFSIPTPAGVKNGASHSIGARVSGTAVTLAASPRSLVCAAVPPVYEGFLDIADCGGISGWAWDKNQPNTPLSVDILDGTAVIATVPAGNFRQDLLNAGKGNGYHGYAISTPSGVKTGTSHSIGARISGTAVTLGASPRAVNCPVPSNAVFVSQIVPVTMNAGARYSVSLTMRNTGTTTWTAAENYRLGSQNPPDNATFGVARAYLSAGDSIAPSQSKSFTFDVTAPLAPGTYNFQWQMVQEGVVWFGDRSPNVVLTVQPVPETVVRSFYPGGEVAGGVPIYSTFDVLGSVRERVDANGGIVGRFDYDAWGRLTVLQGAAPRFGFAGYFYHEPSGLYLTRYRAYDPDLGRWLTPDPIEEDGGANLYAYVENDPVDSVDPLGLCRNPPRRHRSKGHPPKPHTPRGPRHHPPVPQACPGSMLCVEKPVLPTKLPPWDPTTPVLPFLIRHLHDPNIPTIGDITDQEIEDGEREGERLQELCYEIGPCNPYSRFSHPNAEDNPHGSPFRDDAIQRTYSQPPGIPGNRGPAKGLDYSPRIPNSPVRPYEIPPKEIID